MGKQKKQASEADAAAGFLDPSVVSLEEDSAPSSDVKKDKKDKKKKKKKDKKKKNRENQGHDEKTDDMDAMAPNKSQKKRSREEQDDDGIEGNKNLNNLNSSDDPKKYEIVQITQDDSDEESPTEKNNDNDKPPATHEQPHLTRKQKRQKLNQKNKWPQAPKIMSPEAREKAYLRVAGVEVVPDDTQDFPAHKPSPSTGNKKREDDDEELWNRMGRSLGGADQRVRHKSVKRLGNYLKARCGRDVEDEEKLAQVEGISEWDWLRIWKCLWMTLYMADKVPVQDALSKQLSKLIWSVAGKIEEDEFAGQVYLQLAHQQEGDTGDDADMDETEDMEEEDDDEDFKILETKIVNFDGDDDKDDDDNDDESESSEGMEDGEGQERKQKSNRSDSDDNGDIETEEQSSDGEEDDNEDEDPTHTKHVRGAPLASLMTRTFFRTLVRDWGKMDKYRLDKFYTLMRYMLREVYRYMATRQWNVGIIQLFNDAMTEEALVKPPNGVRFHLADIALEELAYVVGSTKDKTLPLTEAIFLEVMEPFMEMAQHGFGDKLVQARAMEKVLGRFLEEFSIVSTANDGRDSDKPVFDQVHVGTISKYIFDLGSAETTLNANRKSLYEMHKAYERQIKKAGFDVDIAPEADDEEDEHYAEGMDNDADDEEKLESMAYMDNEEEDGDGDEDAPRAPKTNDKKKKKRKKKSKDTGVVETPAKSSPPEENDSTGKINKKKAELKEVRKNDMDVTQHDKKGSGKKKKKNSKKNPEADNMMEEEVTISLSEQKKAKNEIKKQKHQQEEKEIGVKGSDNHQTAKKKGKKDKNEKPKRRVSFDAKNMARSYDKSMKGLLKLDPEKAASKTPEKSILLNKGKKSPVSTGKLDRKRAIDYFF